MSVLLYFVAISIDSMIIINFKFDLVFFSLFSIQIRTLNQSSIMSSVQTTICFLIPFFFEILMCLSNSIFFKCSVYLVFFYLFCHCAWYKIDIQYLIHTLSLKHDVWILSIWYEIRWKNKTISCISVNGYKSISRFRNNCWYCNSVEDFVLVVAVMVLFTDRFCVPFS